MYTIDFEKPCHVYFIGIGGISMSALAKLLVHKGFTVSGSDFKKSPATEELEALGCLINYSQVTQNISSSIDLIVYTAAIKANNPEMIQALALDIPAITRADLLGQVMCYYQNAINIAGTHGKTTTTSMISEIFLKADADPTIFLGGILDSIGGNYRLGSHDILINEACEYTNSFLSFNPTLNIILNVEADHLDFFKDIDEIRDSFRRFNGKLKKGNTCIINADIPDYRELTDGYDILVITYSVTDNSADYSTTDLTCDEAGHYSFTLLKNGEPAGDYSLSVTGIHNVSNALAAIACADCFGIDHSTVQEALHSFSGTHRRFEKIGEFNGVTVIDDYAHHPSEIAATLKGAKNIKTGNIWCVFQPHTYSRTKAFLVDFAKALSLADKIVLADIYAARETDTLGVSSEDIKNLLINMGKEAYYFKTFEEIEKFLQKNCINGDMLITMGAGNVVDIAKAMVQ